MTHDGVTGYRLSDGLTIVALAGELDLATKAEVRACLVSLPSATLPDIAVDMTAVTFMDATTLHCITDAHRAAVESGGCLRLGGLAPGPARLVALWRQVDELPLCVFESVADASKPICEASQHQVRA